MPPNSSIDLNADLGEGCPWDETLLGFVTSAAISCGAHAGDPDGIRRTLALARDRGVVVGAHPSFADRDGFGRRPRPITGPEARDLVLEQVDTLAGWASDLGVPVRFIKPHGALYNQAQDDPAIAAGVVEAAGMLGLALLGLPGGAVGRAAAEHGVAFFAEGFADRRYRPDGRLVPRSEPGAVLSDPDEVDRQVLDLVAGGRIQTICLHGDDPGAVALAGRLAALTARHAIAVRSFV